MTKCDIKTVDPKTGKDQYWQVRMMEIPLITTTTLIGRCSDETMADLRLLNDAIARVRKIETHGLNLLPLTEEGVLLPIGGQI